MEKVYLLYHIYNDDDDDVETKLIGVYSSQNLATEAIDRLKSKPGFSTYPSGFQIFEKRVDLDGWTEGFITV